MRAIDLAATARWCVKEAFGRLLNDKHLYQSVEVDWGPVWEAALKEPGPILGAQKRTLANGEKLAVAEIVRSVSSVAWRLEPNPGGRSIAHMAQGDQSTLLQW